MYDGVVYVHILAAFGWAAAVAMGALQCTHSMGHTVRRLALARVVLGAVVVATGLYAAMALGFPVWTHMALGLAFLVAILELVPAVLTFRSAERGSRMYRRTVHVVGVLLIAMLYLMVFKPA